MSSRSSSASCPRTWRRWHKKNDMDGGPVRQEVRHMQCARHDCVTVGSFKSHADLLVALPEQYLRPRIQQRSRSSHDRVGAREGEARHRFELSSRQGVAPQIPDLSRRVGSDDKKICARVQQQWPVPAGSRTQSPARQFDLLSVRAADEHAGTAGARSPAPRAPSSDSDETGRCRCAIAAASRCCRTAASQAAARSGRHRE